MKAPFLVTLFTLALAGVISAQWALPRGEVVFPDKTRVAVEVADTPERLQRGLMFRERMDPGEGMVFVFDEPGYHPFWMKNTLIPLDMIWLDAGRRVVHVAHSVPPCRADPCPSYGPPASAPAAAYVIEVVSGFAARHGVKPGDAVEFKGIGPARGR